MDNTVVLSEMNFIRHKSEIKEELPSDQDHVTSGIHESIKCSQCDKIVCSDKNLKLHVKRVHLQIKDYFCEQCPSSFSTKQELRVHGLSHSGERNFKCNLCEKSFKTNSYLKIHSRIHSGEKPYFCEECGKSFSNQSQMISHKKERHSGDIPFKCDVCEKGFKTQKYFRLHKKTHLEGFIPKPKTEPERRNHSENFKLETIERVSVIGLRQTARELGLEPVLIRGWINVKNEKYKCEKCNGLFAFQSKLTRHIQLKHGDNVTPNSSWTFDNEFRDTVVKFVQENSIQEALQKFSVSDAAVRMWVKKSEAPIMCIMCGTICAYKRQIREHMSNVHNIIDQDEQDTKYFVRNFAPEQSKENKLSTVQSDSASLIKHFEEDRTVFDNGHYLDSELSKDDLEPTQEGIDFQNEIGRLGTESKEFFFDDSDSDHEKEIEIDNEDLNSSYCESIDDLEDMNNIEDLKQGQSEEVRKESSTLKSKVDESENYIKLDNKDIKKETIEEFIDVTQVMKVNISEAPSVSDQDVIVKEEHIQHIPTSPCDGINKTCQFCQKTFRDRYKLKVHLLTHSGEKTHTCNLCQQSFALAHQLTRHMLTHKEKTLVCSHCPKMFSDQKLLDLHLKGLNDIFLCNFCTKTFKRKGHLKVHLRLHTGETPYVCTSCDARFHRSSKLKEHNIQNHEAPRQTFMCESCGKEYARRGDMLDHMRVHTGEEPFHCEICNISFSCRRKYIGHKNTHEKNKMCKECGKCFESNANLRRHEKTHAGIKDFQCELCSKAYSSNKSLSQHMEIVHKIGQENSKTFSCYTCDKSFTRNEYLQRHLLKH